MFKAIPGWPGYEVSDEGVVVSYKKTCSYELSKVPKIMKSTVDPKTGYERVKLRNKYSQKFFSVHVLVLTTFVGPRPEGCEGSHLDDVRTNNVLTNLLWETKQANTDRRRRYKGVANPNVKLTDELVLEIRMRYATGRISQEALGKEYGVHQTMISNIVRKDFWTHI